jgi:hypothetical protein
MVHIIGKHEGTWVAPVKSEDYAKDRRFKSPSGHFIVKRKNSMNYGPTTAVLHSQNQPKPIQQG